MPFFGSVYTESGVIVLVGVRLKGPGTMADRLTKYYMDERRRSL